MSAVALTEGAGTGKASAPVGTRDWADWVRLYSLDAVSKRLEGPIRLKTVYEVIKANEAWRLMNKPDGTFFASLEEFSAHRRPWGWGEPIGAIQPAIDLADGKITKVEAEERIKLATAEAVAAAKPAKAVGAPKGSKNNAAGRAGKTTENLEVTKESNRHISSGGQSRERLAARLKRDRPDIAARAEAGEFSSVRAAAIEAGIVKVATPEQKAAKALAKLPEWQADRVIVAASPPPPAKPETVDDLRAAFRALSDADRERFVAWAFGMLTAEAQRRILENRGL